MPTPTVATATPPPVTASQIYGFAAVCGLAEPIVLEQTTPREDVTLLLELVFPDWTSEQRDRLWDRGRMDAAALGQADRLDTWSWPCKEYDPPEPKLRTQYASFVCDLEQSVQAWILEAARS